MPSLSAAEARTRFHASRVAILGTSDTDGRPHLVPVVFAVDGHRVVTAVDHKPKRSSRLRRLDNIERNHEASLIADRYDEDWSRLWWVRVDGAAHLAGVGGAFDAGIEALVAKYPQYHDRPPAGPLIVIDIRKVVGWAAVAMGE